MPSGTHKGKKMCDIPKDYFIWLWNNNRCSPEVKEYIRENVDSIWPEGEKPKERRPSEGFNPYLYGFRDTPVRNTGRGGKARRR